MGKARRAGHERKTLISIGTYDGGLIGVGISEADEIAQIFGFATEHGLVKSVAAAGPYLAVGSSSDSIQLYDCQKLCEAGVVFCHNAAVTALEFVSDVKDAYLISASADGKVCVIKRSNWETVFSFQAHKAEVLGLAVHPTGKLALTISSDFTLRMWDLMRGTCAAVRPITGAKSAVCLNLPLAVKFSPTGDSYYVLCQDRLERWSSSEDTSISVKGRYSCVCFVSDTLMIAGDNTGALYSITVSDGSLVVKKFADKVHEGRIKGLEKISEDRICSACASGKIVLWALVGDELEALTEMNTNLRVTCMTASSPSA